MNKYKIPNEINTKHSYKCEKTISLVFISSNLKCRKEIRMLFYPSFMAKRIFYFDCFGDEDMPIYNSVLNFIQCAKLLKYKAKVLVAHV